MIPSLQHLASIPQCGNNLGGVAFNLGGALNLTREKTKELWDPAGESIGCHSGGDHSNQAKVLLAVLYHCEGQDGCATEVVFASAVDGPILDDTCVAENWRFLPKYQYSTYIDKPQCFILLKYFTLQHLQHLQHLTLQHLTLVQHLRVQNLFNISRLQQQLCLTRPGVPDQSIEAGFKRALSQQGK